MYLFSDPVRNYRKWQHLTSILPRKHRFLKSFMLYKAWLSSYNKRKYYSLFWQWIFWFMFRFISYSSFNREQQCCLTKHNGSKNVAGVIRSYSWIKEEFLLHLHEGNRWSDCYARLPQRLYLLLLFIGRIIIP